MIVKKAKKISHKHIFTQDSDFFRRLLDSLEGYAVFLVDLRGRVVSWNAGAERILKYSEREIIGKNYSTFFTKEDKRKKVPQTELKNAMDVHMPVNEGWRVRKDGEMFWATGLVFPFRDEYGTIIGFTKIMRDRTERRKLEEQKDMFIGTASHELRTPITSLKLFSDILSDQAKEAGIADIIASSEIIRSQVDRLVILMNELLNVSRIQSGQIEVTRQTFDITKLIREIASQAQTTTLSHRIILQLKAKNQVRADRVRIGQVLTNLISNAIKYSPGADKIIVRTSEKNGEVLVEVQDFGIGIPEQDHGRVFERFFRTSHAKHKHISGFGLGLYISSEIIKKHDSRIKIKSTLGKGSTFSFCLPFAAK